MMHRREVYEVHRLTFDELDQLASDFDGNRDMAKRAAITTSHASLVARHPGLNQANLVVDITEGMGAYVRWVMHEGQHVPAVQTRAYTRRYGLTAWLALMGVVA